MGHASPTSLSFHFRGCPWYVLENLVCSGFDKVRVKVEGGSNLLELLCLCEVFFRVDCGIAVDSDSVRSIQALSLKVKK